jgi:murein DD-endopeptidase MepM/ murein hydrolase activator NlpD
VNGRVSSEYGYRWGRLHAGIDIAAPTGTPIHAAAPGTVIFAGQQRGYGNVVIIDHGGSFTTVYAHQSRMAVHKGTTLSRGGLVGYVGSTGHSTGPHVHFETRYSGSPRNPRSCLG